MIRAGIPALAAAALLWACNEKTPDPSGPSPAPAAAKSAAQSAAPGSQPARAAGSATPKAPRRVAATPSAPAQAQPYRPPAVARALSAAHTQAVVGVEGLDWLFRNVARIQAQVLPALPAEALADLPPPLKDPKFLPSALGFAPETPAGWQNLGVQPGAGLSVVLDDRLMIEGEPRPLLAAQITDQGKFLNFLKGMERRHGPGKGVGLTGAAEGPCKFLKISEAEACLGSRRGVTFMMPLPKGKAERRAAMVKAFGVIMSDAGPALSDAQDFKGALRTYPGTPAAFAWVDHKVSGALWARQKAKGSVPPEAAFFLDRFPASAIWYGRRGGGLRISADPAGAAALAQILAPSDPPPDVAALMGPRRAVQRFALNLPSLFEGVAALVPPSQGQAKGQILLAKNMIPIATGVAWEDLAGGLTGHGAIIVDIPPTLPAAQPNPDSVLVVLGVKDATKAQRALDGATRKLLKADPNLAGPKVTVAGREVQSFSPLKVVAVIEGDRLLAGTAAAVNQALAAKHSPPASVRAALEQSAFLAFAMPIQPMMDAIQMPPDVKFDRATAKVFWDRILTDGYMVGGLQVDDHGLTSISGGGAVMLTGIVAAVAIPAFVKYIKRSKASMARIEVMRLATAAEAYRVEHGQYPPSAPLSPAEGGPCTGGDDSGGFEADPEMFAHPTWKALGFELQGKSYYRFAFESDGKSFTARALGDLDCDGVLSTYERSPGSARLEVQNELE